MAKIIYNFKNSRGPSIEPCGTPQITFWNSVLLEFSYAMEKFFKCFLTVLRAVEMHQIHKYFKHNNRHTFLNHEIFEAHFSGA